MGLAGTETQALAFQACSFSYHKIFYRDGKESKIEKELEHTPFSPSDEIPLYFHSMCCFYRFGQSGCMPKSLGNAL